MTASFCRQTDSVGKRVADDRAFAITGGNDGVAGSVFSGIQNGIAALCADIGLGTLRLNLFELLLAVRLAAAGIDGFDQNFIFVHSSCSFLFLGRI